MSGLKEYAGFNDSGVADREYKLPTPGNHVVEVVEGTKIFETQTEEGVIRKINIPFVCSKGDSTEGMKFNIQVWVGGKYPKTATNVITAIVVAAGADEKFLDGFSKNKARVERIGYPITIENLEKIVDPDVAQETVNAVNVLLPGNPFGATLAISKGDYPKVNFTKYFIPGTTAFKEVFSGNKPSGKTKVAVEQTSIIEEDEVESETWR